MFTKGKRTCSCKKSDSVNDESGTSSLGNKSPKRIGRSRSKSQESDMACSRSNSFKEAASPNRESKVYTY